MSTPGKTMTQVRQDAETKTETQMVLGWLIQEYEDDPNDTLELLLKLVNGNITPQEVKYNVLETIKVQSREWVKDGLCTMNERETEVNQFIKSGKAFQDYPISQDLG